MNNTIAAAVALYPILFLAGYLLGSLGNDNERR